METSTANKLRINIAKWHCLSLRISTEATIEYRLARSLGIEPGRRFQRFYEEYSRNGVRHSILLRFASEVSQPDHYAMRLVLVYEMPEPDDVAVVDRKAKAKPKPTEVFLQLCNLETSFLFRCDCLFSHKRGQEGVQFPLPMKITGDAFTEIRGLRLVRTEQGKIVYEKSLDLVDSDTLTNRIKFVHEGRCSVELPLKLLQRAKQISVI